MAHIQQRNNGNEAYYEDGKPVYFRYRTGEISRIYDITSQGYFMCKALTDDEQKQAKECFRKVEQHKKER